MVTSEDANHFPSLSQTRLSGFRWTAGQLSEWQQIGRRNTEFPTDLGNAGAWQDVAASPVENRGAGTAEALAEGRRPTGLVDQELDGQQHSPQGRLFRRDLSTTRVGLIDALWRSLSQTASMSTLKAIGRRVQDLRRAEGIGQEELAAIVGVSRSTIAGIETGGDRGGIETMIAIADHYKVAMDWLLGRHLPAGSPPAGKLVYRPDQIAILDYWDSLSFEDKQAVVRALHIPCPNESL